MSRGRRNHGKTAGPSPQFSPLSPHGGEDAQIFSGNQQFPRVEDPIVTAVLDLLADAILADVMGANRGDDGSFPGGTER